MVLQLFQSYFYPILFRVTALQEKLGSLEDKLEEPRQEFEQSKKDEQERRKKVETFRREIEVRFILISSSEKDFYSFNCYPGRY